MRELIIVGLGSFFGGSARHLVNHLTIHYSNHLRFPISTLIINLLGCFLIGFIAGIAENISLFTHQTRMFLITGVLGGFTTFSAFGIESFSLIRNGRPELAILNICLSVIGGILAVWLGFRFGK